MNFKGKIVPRFVWKKKMPLQARPDFLALVSRHSRLVEIDAASEQAAPGACRDAKVAEFLALAMACQAVALITSDADLLVLHPRRGVPILTPAAPLQAMGV